MNRVRTPCVGICSATSFGDEVCRGCGRRDYEVRDWNTYSEDKKREIVERLKRTRTEV